MNRIKMWLAALMIGLLAQIVYAADISSTPVGYWKTVDDVTGKPKSIIQIWKAENNVLMGKVVKIFPNKGDDLNKICTACEGAKRNKPIVGMVILSGLKANQNRWTNGEILDPENGKTYSCSARLADSGKKLSVHGYVGLPLLGRSQTWERIDLMSDK